MLHISDMENPTNNEKISVSVNYTNIKTRIDFHLTTDVETFIDYGRRLQAFTDMLGLGSFDTPEPAPFEQPAKRKKRGA